jgi:polysaccharide pyruvyl transferase WcaK-like protein
MYSGYYESMASCLIRDRHRRARCLVEQLCAQLTQTDMVVATRFHNILLALMLNQPVLPLSYHEKVRSLMGAWDWRSTARTSPGWTSSSPKVVTSYRPDRYAT